MDIKDIPELTGIAREGQRLSIGATTTYRTLQSSPELCSALPELVGLIGRIANVRVRAAGTLGGNLCFVEPHSDPATLLLACDAEVECAGVQGVRRLPLREFLVGPLQSALEPDELLTRIHVTLSEHRTGVGYQRIAHLERPTANVAVRLEVNASGAVRSARIAVGAVGPVPARQVHAEELLSGLALPEVPKRADAVAAAVSEQVDVMEDMHGSADYKRHLAGELCRRALAEALTQLGTGGREP